CVGMPVRENGVVTRFVGTLMDITEQEELTQELRRREAYLAEAQRLSHTGSFGWDVSSGEINWSKETFRIFELDPKTEITIELIVQRTHPDDRQAVQQVIERASSERTEFALEHRLLMPDGSIKYLRVMGRPLQDEGRRSEFVGAVTDMTDRRQAEESLRKSEAYLADAQSLSQTGSWAWSPAEGIKYWSEENYRVQSFEPRDGLPRFEEFFQRIHPDDQPRLKELMETLIREKNDVETDYRIIHPGGAVREIHSTCHPVIGPSGDLVEVIGTVIDVTEQKKADEKLRASERKYRHLVDTTPAFIHTALPDGSLDFLSRGWLEYGGIPQTDLLDWRWTEAIHPDDAEEFADKWRAAIASGEPFEAESRVRGAHGEYRWFLQRNVPLRDETGNIVKWYGTGIDIEERKRADEELRRSEAYLTEAQKLSQTGSWAWSPDKDITYWSEECYRVLSFDPRDGLPRSEEFFGAIHPDDRPRFTELTER